MIFKIVPTEEVSVETAIRKATQKELALTPSKMTREQQQMGNPILTTFAVSSYITEAPENIRMQEVPKQRYKQQNIGQQKPASLGASKPSSGERPSV